MNIVLYCSSRDNLDNAFQDTAKVVGEWIGENRHSLVYGGVDAGMMHIAALYAKNCGATIIGVIPERFKNRADELNDKLIFTADLCERKAKMIELGDIFIVLPGGIGTIDEWMSTLSQFVVEADERRKIIVVNINGIYDNIINQIKITAQSPFARSNALNSSIIVTSIDEFINELNKLNPML
ncbi:MAG: TIGR00730 family Rossman fold protein [Muribaculaceae bacterium]